MIRNNHTSQIHNYYLQETHTQAQRNPLAHLRAAIQQLLLDIIFLLLNLVHVLPICKEALGARGLLCVWEENMIPELSMQGLHTVLTTNSQLQKVCYLTTNSHLQKVCYH